MGDAQLIGTKCLCFRFAAGGSKYMYLLLYMSPVGHFTVHLLTLVPLLLLTLCTSSPGCLSPQQREMQLHPCCALSGLISMAERGDFSM